MQLQVLGAAIGGAAICVAALAAQDALTTIGVRPADGKAQVFRAIGEGRVSWDPVKAVFKAASAETRAALVTGVLAWAREFTESEEFKRRYASLHKGSEPRAPRPSKPAEDEIMQQQAALDRRIELERKGLAAPPSPRLSAEAVEKARKQDEERLKGLVDRRATYDDPKARAEMRAAIETRVASEQQKYQEDLAKWKEQYPADVRPVIAKRLRQFLDESATVDFGAAMTPCRKKGGSFSCFADPNFEKKSAEWKLCYRVGRKPLEAARAFAASWLASLEKP